MTWVLHPVEPGTRLVPTACGGVVSVAVHDLDGEHAALFAARDFLGLSLREAAKLIGLTAQQLSDLENGRARAPGQVAKMIEKLRSASAP